MKTWFCALVLSFTLGAAACGTATCGEVCSRVKRCGLLPGPLGNDEASCVQLCAAAVPRVGDSVRACIAASPCDSIAVGRCGNWQQQP